MGHLKELFLAGFMLAIERDGASIAELRAANNIGIDAATEHFKHAGRTEQIFLKKINFQAVLGVLRRGP